ncbi:MAG TPA: PAS domain S-box protein [Longimicrobiales bacterium]
MDAGTHQLRAADFLRAVTEELPDAVFVKDLDGRYLFVNSPGAALVGRAPEDIVGHTDEEIFGAEVAAVFRANDLAALAGDAPKVAEERATINGRHLVFQALKAPWHDEQGVVRGVLGISRDVTALKEAEARLHEAQQRYRIAFEHAPIGMALAGIDGRWLYANQAMCKLTGYTAAELTQMSFSDLTFPPDREQTQAQAQQLLTGEVSSVDAVKRYQRKNGSPVWVRRTASLVHDERGQPNYFIVQVQDITHEHEMEKALQESERQYRQLFEMMAEGAVFHDADGTLTLANAAALRIVGMPAQELEGVHIHDARWHYLREDGSEVAPEDLPAAVAQREAREVRDVMLGICRAGQPTRWVLINSLPLFNPGEAKPHRVFSTMSDVTRLRMAEEAVRASEERFRVLVENASELVFTTDENGRFTFVSQSFDRGLGYEPSELIGQDVYSLLHPEDRQHAREKVAYAVAHPEELVSCQVRALRSNGEWSIMEGLLRSMLDHPAIRGIVINARDITDRWQAEQTLEQREQELRQAQKMEAVGRLAGGIAHDFNNVLTAISGHAEFLAEMFAENDPVHVDIDGIRTAADRAARLTAQLLAFSRTQLMQPVDLDMREVVAGIRIMLQRLIGEDIELQCELPAERMSVHADRTQIEQVLLNLAVNARDAMPRGGTLTLKVAPAEFTELSTAGDAEVKAGHYIVLSVSDTGEGIRPEIADKIFEPFFTTKARGQGSGLGLSTVYGIVKQSGGYVLMHSAPGRGARFDVLLPRYVATLPDMGRAYARPAQADSDAKTILVVEDEASVRNMAERVLRRQGYMVLTAHNGVEALAMIHARGGNVDVVVTDVVMPEMSGPQLAAELTQSYPDTPIIFMSGYTANEINEEGIKAAEAAFLPKPFTPQELARKVRDALTEKSATKNRY